MEAFAEEQNFLKRWWFILLPVLVVPLISVVSAYKSAPLLAAVGTPFIIMALVIVLFALLTLHTRVDERGIAIRFAPFHRKDRFIEWSTIKSARVIKYDPLFEYGGWGFRKGWTRRKTAYNVSGRTGLELELNDDRTILIGTVKKDELLSYLNYLKTKYSITAIGEAA